MVEVIEQVMRTYALMVTYTCGGAGCAGTTGRNF